ncbi:hypothetical protein [Paraburkholderia nodosa]|uniref:hypothetical protein n=1 Tax=Paraburkholderia nodosa TaxID=392320 RepID=UPI0004B4E9A2|nr:hypothetical protein [Paraburkholderia nodosa]
MGRIIASLLAGHEPRALLDRARLTLLYWQVGRRVREAFWEGRVPGTGSSWSARWPAG